MIWRSAVSPLRQPWPFIAACGFLMMSFFSGGANAAEIEALAPLLPPSSSSNQQSVGEGLSLASEIYFNETTKLRCNVRENTPGYITTIFLSNSQFVFGCLSESASLYYFSVAFSGLNFPNTPVWVANPHNSVKEAASFVLDPQGPAFLETADGIRLWSSKTDGQNAAGLRLTSQGNLVLFDHSNRSLWESFGEPIDTLVPGQVLNPGTSLVAGFSSHFPGTGNFVAVMRKGGLVFYENSTSQALPYYALGYPLVSTTIDEILNGPCNHTRLVLNTSSLTQIQSPGSPACKPPSSSMRLNISFNGPIVFVRLEPNGLFKAYYPDHRPAYDIFGNSSKGDCGVPNACGPYGICENSHCRCLGNESLIGQSFNLSHNSNFLLSSNSCVPKVPITCLHEDNPGFQYLIDVGNVDYFANDFIGPTMLVDSMDACKAACLQNCSCQATFYRKKSKYCYLHEKIMSMIGVSDSDYVGAVKLQKEDPVEKKLELGLILGISTFAVSAILLLGGLCYYYRRRRLIQKTLKSDGDDEILAALPGQPKKLSYKELQAATWEFSQKLGVGGFGSVYKGVLPDGSFVAVKQLENTTRFTQGMKEFRNEVIALSNINHQNLVHLRGFCADSGHRLLVYEYVSNGSLDTWLFCKGGLRPGPPLDWKTRLAIAVQTAQGLVFLHEQCRNRIVHLDIKPQNILLDENFVPKLSDFGLSRLMNEDKDSAVSRMRGTPGYMAPECLILTDATEKSDVYSFGMVLLELLSGRKNVDVSRLTVHGDGESWYFPTLASRKYKEGNVIDILDRSLLPLDPKCMEETTRVVRIAFWCIQDNPSLRPTMGKALLMLEGYTKVGEPPLSTRFGMRFHLCNSITPPNRSPANGTLQNEFSKLEHTENGEHHSAVTRKECREKGDSSGACLTPRSLQTTPLSSHPASPLASPRTRLASHYSFPRSNHYQVSSRPSPLSDNLSSGRPSQKASPQILSPRQTLSPLSHSVQASPPYASSRSPLESPRYT